MATDRDAYDLTETPERRLVLGYVIDSKIHTWAATPISNATQQPLEEPLIRAFHDLGRAGLVIGDVITGKGYRAALDWGLKK
jgi:hypothetical protein